MFDDILAGVSALGTAATSDSSSAPAAGARRSGGGTAVVQRFVLRESSVPRPDAQGRLTRRQLQGWVANRLAYQRAIPRKDAALLSNCPDPAVRREWLQRIIDHDGTEPGSGGIEMWIRLGEALGVPREEMEDERHVLPGVRFATEAYVTFCRTKPWIDGVASSLTELFAPDLMRRRIAAFPQHYPWVRADALDYFKSRLTQAPRDSQHGLRIVLTHCTTVETQRRAFEALAFKLELLWLMIDTIHHAYLEP